MNSLLRTTTAVALAFSVAVGMSACAFLSPKPVETVTADPTAPPAPSEFDGIEGNEIHLKVGDFFEVTVPPGDVTKWMGKFSQDGVVTFVPGYVDGSTTWQPGFSGKTSGKTNVDLTNGEKSVSFTIVVD